MFCSTTVTRWRFISQCRSQGENVWVATPATCLKEKKSLIASSAHPRSLSPSSGEQVSDVYPHQIESSQRPSRIHNSTPTRPSFPQPDTWYPRKKKLLASGFIIPRPNSSINRYAKTYWRPVIPSYACHDARSASGSTGNAIADQTNNNCNAVLTLETKVGLTSAEGSEKSQYLAIVFGGGSDIQRK